MKSEEEIEEIANKIYDEYTGYHKVSFVNGYMQCQKDMAKELEQVDIICPKCKGINEYFIEKNGDYKCAYTDCEHTFKKNKTNIKQLL